MSFVKPSIWLILCLSFCNHLCKILPYWTANYNWTRLYGDSKIFWYMYHDIILILILLTRLWFNSLWSNTILVNIGSSNGLLPVQHQAINWTNCKLFTWEQTLVRFESKYKNLVSRKCMMQHLKMSAVRREHFVQVSMCNFMIWLTTD